LSALAAAARTEPSYRQAADKTYRFIRDEMIGKDGLKKSLAKGKKLAGAELEDYAYVVQGLLDYADVSGLAEAQGLALKLTQSAWQTYASAQGWQREKQALLATTRPEPALSDGPTASPSAVLISATLRLNDKALNARAREALLWYSQDMGRDPFSHATQIAAYRQVAKGGE